MCGLAGFTGFTNNIGLAQSANIIQAHRGPDNQSTWNDDWIALAHQRLSIIDLSDAANQPFTRDGLVIIFNGEIYNYKELQQKLKTEKQAKLSTSSDTEVILEMYRHYGADCLDFFIGMFVFAIYDINKKSLFIARDHFGIKPLFYTCIGTGFAFSSELKTLVNIPGFNKAINSKSLVSCLNYLWVSGNESMFENCHKLPPAHYMTYSDESGLKLKRYWELEDNTTQNGFDETDSIAELGNTIVSSVQRHMVADVPVSSFLSGGLDSSLVSVLAKQTNKDLSTYTISFTEKDKAIEQMPDDEKYSRIVAEKFGLHHNVIEITPDIITAMPAMVKMLDEPIGDPAAINTFLICQAARKKGVKILLSGMGADEIYFGYRRQKATLMASRYRKLPRVLRNITATLGNALPVQVMGRGFKLGRWSKRFLSFASLPTHKAYMRSYSYYSPDDLGRLLKDNHAAGIQALMKEHEELFASRYKNDTINQICNVDIQMFMLGLNLTYTDRASMAASIEVRVPFIDKTVITKAMKIPGSLKIKKGESKYVLKKAAEKYLPQDIIYRPKAAFGAPLRSWISNELRPMVDDLLSKENVEKRSLLNYSFVESLIKNDRSGKDDNAYQIYQLLTLELWCREYLD